MKEHKGKEYAQHKKKSIKSYGWYFKNIKEKEAKKEERKLENDSLLKKEEINDGELTNLLHMSKI